MKVNFILLFISIWLRLPIIGAVPLSCYTCAGHACLAREEFQKQCASDATTECFYFTANNTEMYRGCYEKSQEYYGLCEDHILNTCVLCNTTLCNDKPAYNPNIIACYQCSPSHAKCRDTEIRRHHYKPCKPSLFTDRPACYSMYDHRTYEYEFGCMSEANVVTRATCDNDWFRKTCVICYNSRCNVDLFYKEIDGDVAC